MHRLGLGLCAATVLLAAVPAVAQTIDPARGVVRPAAPQSATSALRPGPGMSTFVTIQGNALDATNGPLPEAAVRLRDARYGRILGSQITDHAGLFRFDSIEPGTYVVELVAKDQSVLAASQLLTVGAGETASAVVKLPFRVAPFAGIFGHTVQQAAAIAAAAAASGVLATNVTGVDSSAR